MNGAIILAGGRGKRMGAGMNKQYLMLHGRCILSYAIESLAKVVDELIIVIATGEKDAAAQAVVEAGVAISRCQFVGGGKERQDSVRNALLAMPNTWDKVLIHDGARPFVPVTVIENLLEQTTVGLGTIPGLSVTDTIKRVDEKGLVVETPNRALLRAIQTPQAFVAKDIQKLHLMAAETSAVFTDDASICEYFGYSIQVVEGALMMQKMTVKEDFIWAEKMHSEWEEMHQ